PPALGAAALMAVAELGEWLLAAVVGVPVDGGATSVLACDVVPAAGLAAPPLVAGAVAGAAGLAAWANACPSQLRAKRADAKARNHHCFAHPLARSRLFIATLVWFAWSSVWARLCNCTPTGSK